MTILTVKNQLVTHFLQHDTFDFSRHALDIEFDKEVVGFREEMVHAACVELEQLGLIKKVVSDSREKQIWVLVQPLVAAQQSVVLGPLVSEIIGNVINHYNEIEELDERCDKTKISELDILRLVQIIQNYEDEDDGTIPPELIGGQGDN